MTEHEENWPPEVRAILGIHVVHGQLETMIHEIELKLPLTSNERIFIVRLSHPMRMGEIAKMLQAPPSTVTALADELEGKGLVQRERDPKDRRALFLTLTEEGERIKQELFSIAVDVFNELFGLEAEDVSSLANLLDKIRDRVGNGKFPKEFSV